MIEKDLAHQPLDPSSDIINQKKYGCNQFGQEKAYDNRKYGTPNTFRLSMLADVGQKKKKQYRSN
jgi:hypothetical protein